LYGVACAGFAEPWLRSAVVTQSVDVGFAWCPKPVPQGMPVVQVYGWLLDDTGRVLVQDTGEGFNLPGGSPESIDPDLASTLAREALEESQVTVTDVAYLGYEQVERDGRPRALVRMVGRIGEFRPRHPDPDGGRLLGRLMTSLDEAPGLLGWGQSGLAQAQAASRIAGRWWEIPVERPTLPASYLD
jgi:ADP-ribose pyrophosphatase YjhB (NUDIX family)